MAEPRRYQRTRLPQYLRSADQSPPPGTIYVGRPSIYGNPFRLGESYCGPTIRAHHTAAGVVEAFRTWLALDTLDPLFWDRELIVAHVKIKAALIRGDLAGRDVSCWCPLVDDEGRRVPCHADILLAAANPGLVIKAA